MTASVGCSMVGSSRSSHVVLVYTAEPGSESAQKLRLLASWAAEHPATQEGMAAAATSGLSSPRDGEGR
ncbi:hypothetical protein ACF1AJ_10315 [Leifsonia sp. NPDC014704]|uniref:hypothetical protein n=1 Tax=Leifsonia sp. NPDC014704 TaxID=3364123 RepID=UPI0036F48178